jgi:hypothetical protein
MLQKSETNNAIITTLANVRKHPNANRLQLATVFGTQVIIGLEAKEGDIVIYFDSNLRLSPEYLRWNNLYSNKEMNLDTSQKGYFGKNGRVRAQKLRGEISNGFVAPTHSLDYIEEVDVSEIVFNVGDEFTHINGREICSKYFIPSEVYSERGLTCKKPRSIRAKYFWKHYDVKHLMREKDKIALGVLYVEEKIHGTSGRTGHVLCDTGKKWWQFWKPETKWVIMSGTRRVDSIRRRHIASVRSEIQEKVAPHLRKGEQIYYEIYGFDSEGGKPIQHGFSYGCLPRQYKVLLYRVTITTPDGFCIDLDREQVYKRAEELGLEKPTLLLNVYCTRSKELLFLDPIAIPGVMEPYTQFDLLTKLAKGKSALDANTMREGIVVWFKNIYGKWDCLKHKSEEFLIKESELRDKEIGDVEDNL